MKYLNIIILIVAASLTGCLQKDKGNLRIDSLSCDGDEFYCYQKIKMWMCVESDNLFIAKYEWGCDDGHFSEGQGFSEACWIPHTVGEHEVWCKVTVGKNTETRYRKMNVSRYYFDFFENAAYSDGSNNYTITTPVRSRPLTWQVQGSNTNTDITKTLLKDDKGNGYMTFKLNSTSQATRYINRSFTADPNLTVPFSCRATIGWVSAMPADSVTVGTTTAAPTLSYQLITDRDLNSTGVYVDQINFVWFPRSSATTNKIPVDPAGSGKKCNGRFTFRQTGVGSSLPLPDPPIWFYHPALEFAAAEYKKVTFTIAEDYTVTVYVAGTKVFETDALKKWRSANNFTGKMLIREWRIPLPNSNGGTNPPTYYLSCTVAQNTGFTFTGAANEEPLK